MKKIVFLSIIMVILLGACSPSTIFSRTVRGSGVVGSEVRSVSDFTSIGVVGSANVSIVFGETELVAITTDENLLPYIKTEVRSGKLIIHNQENTRVSFPLGIHIKVTMKTLTSATLDGSGDISIADIHTDALGVNLLGSGSIKVSGIAKTLSGQSEWLRGYLCP